MSHNPNQLYQQPTAVFGSPDVPNITKAIQQQNNQTRISTMKNKNIKGSNKPKKSVRFAPTIKGIFLDYPKHEQAARWRTKDDEASTHAELRDTLSIMRVHQGTVPAHLQDANVATCRGLEHMASKRTLQDNSRAKSLAISAVLDEADRQAEIVQLHRNNEYARQESLETIATISSFHTAQARSIAQLRGEADAAYVQRELSGVDPSWKRLSSVLNQINK